MHTEVSGDCSMCSFCFNCFPIWTDLQARKAWLGYFNLAGKANSVIEGDNFSTIAPITFGKNNGWKTVSSYVSPTQMSSNPATQILHSTLIKTLSQICEHLFLSLEEKWVFQKKCKTQDWNIEKHVTKDKHLEQACHFGHLHHNSCRPRHSHLHSSAHMQPCHQSADAHTW